MTFDINFLKIKVKDAFKDRGMPSGNLVRSNFNIGYHQEAMRVDGYFRANKNITDRCNSALVAFTYLTPEASLWVLGKYMTYIIDNFEDDDILIAVTIGAITSGMPCRDFKSPGDLGLQMRKLATRQEVDAVNSFCVWINNNTSEIGIDEIIVEALELWR